MRYLSRAFYVAVAAAIAHSINTTRQLAAMYSKGVMAPSPRYPAWQSCLSRDICATGLWTSTGSTSVGIRTYQLACGGWGTLKAQLMRSKDKSVSWGAYLRHSGMIVAHVWLWAWLRSVRGVCASVGALRDGGSHLASQVPRGLYGLVLRSYRLFDGHCCQRYLRTRPPNKSTLSCQLPLGNKQSSSSNFLTSATNSGGKSLGT